MYPELALAGAGGYEYAEHDGESGGLFDLSTAAGWALILAIAGFLVVAVILGRGKGIVAGIGSALGLAIVVTGTELWVHFLAHSWALNNPDSPIAGGLVVDL